MAAFCDAAAGRGVIHFYRLRENRTQTEVTFLRIVRYGLEASGFATTKLAWVVEPRGELNEHSA